MSSEGRLQEDCPGSKRARVDACSEKMLLTPEQVGKSIPIVMRLGQAHFASQAMFAMVQLGVPDIIGNKCLSVEQIADKLSGFPNRDALSRCMRIVATTGIFAESAGPDGAARYALTPAGALLQTGLQQPSLACCYHHVTEKPMWGAFSELPDYVAGTTSTPPFEKFNGAPIFDYYKSHPESGGPFNQFMKDSIPGFLPIILDCVDWKAWAGKTVVDVGGGQGAVMGAVKGKFADVNCVTFDLPGVIAAVETPPNGVALVGGDMFDSTTIPKGDMIFLKHILHDWDDEASKRILTACHAALPAHGEVIIFEFVLPKPGELESGFTPGLYSDALMMIIGGKERTAEQFGDLARSTNFKIKSVNFRADDVKKMRHATIHLVKA